MWYISSNLNNGYPYNTNFIGIISDVWTEGKHNYSLWRIDPENKINNGYPYTYYMQEWLGDDSGGETGEGDIFPAGEYYNSYDSIKQADRGDMNVSYQDRRRKTIGSLSTAVAVGLNAYAVSIADINTLKNSLKNKALNDTNYQLFIQQLYGGSLFDCVLMCKAYNFTLPQGASYNGFITTLNELAPETTTHLLGATSTILDFGEIDLNVTQGYEISKYDYKIYLPYAGLYSLDIKGNEKIYLLGYVDLLSGVIDYIVFINNQEELTAQGRCDVDIPINTRQAEGMYNVQLKQIEYATKAVSSVAPFAGWMSTVPGLQEIGSGLAYGADKVNSAAMSQHRTLTGSAIGSGNNGNNMNLQPCIICKQLEMLNKNLGVEQIQGAVHNIHPTGLGNLNGFTKFINFRCDITGITAEEKTEIENLMNNGVII